jgi:ribonuclease R
MVERNQLIEYMEHEVYRPLTVQELVAEFSVEAADEFREFVKLLNQMEEAGEVIRTRTNRYGVPERMNLVVGKLQMKARGFGFVIPESTGDADVYIPSGDMNGALSGDKVMARVEKVGGGPHREGKIIRVLERATNRVVGRFTHHRGYGFVAPLDKRFQQDIFIPGEALADAHDGFIVVAEITDYPTAARGPEGKIVEVLGHPDEPGIDILAIVRKYDLPEVFPEAVLTAAEEIPLELTEKDFEGRRDLRDEVIVTIDGDDAKDLDDAVHVKRLSNGNFVLGVHIADVGYYVRENGVIDKEAFRRGTSVYLVDRVIPMIPQRLSNNVCSLNPKVDRLTLSCVMEITDSGEVVEHDIFPSVIRTTERMTYTNVRKILQNEDEEVRARYEPLILNFELMEELALILRGKRMRRGAIDFDFEEIKVVVDEIGQPVDIVPRERSIAERIIEEFMLAANETVAEHFHWLNVPFVYRIHEEPDLDRMMELNEFVHNFGYHIKGLGNKIHPRSLQDILEKAEGSREERMIATVMLRSMRQAKYAPECTGHFGLAAEYYTHFTSPIRRYPDLMIHRIIREVLVGKLTPERDDKLREIVRSASAQSSERERIAQDAERECDQLKMVEYMMDHIGESFDGIISGVTQFGLFIQLNNGVEGLIHVSYLSDDYYVLSEKQMALIGERTRRVFRMGDPVRVRVAGASKDTLTIDFELEKHYREGTMEWGLDGGKIVYDEDLTPKERKAQIAMRKEHAKEDRRRGGDFRRNSSEGRRNGSDGRRTGSEARRNGGDGRRNSNEARRNGGDGRRDSGEARRTGSDGRRTGSEARRNGGDGRRNSGEARRNGGEARRTGSEARRQNDSFRRSKDGARRDGGEARPSGVRGSDGSEDKQRGAVAGDRQFGGREREREWGRSRERGRKQGEDRDESQSQGREFDMDKGFEDQGRGQDQEQDRGQQRSHGKSSGRSARDGRRRYGDDRPGDGRKRRGYDRDRDGLVDERRDDSQTDERNLVSNGGYSRGYGSGGFDRDGSSRDRASRDSGSRAGSGRGRNQDSNRDSNRDSSDRSSSQAAAGRGHGMEPFWMNAPKSANQKKKHKNSGFAKGGMKAGDRKHSKG